jgi:hypothetical protein
LKVPHIVFKLIDFHLGVLTHRRRHFKYQDIESITVSKIKSV